MKELLVTTCILCPNGCSLRLLDGQEGYQVTGNACPKGVDYALAEYRHPMRTVTSTVRTIYPNKPRLAVKTSQPISKDQIFEVMAIINHIRVDHPVACGDILSDKILGTETAIIATDQIREGD